MLKKQQDRKIQLYAPYRNFYLRKYYNNNSKNPSDFFWGVNTLNKKLYKIKTSFSKRGERKSIYSYLSYFFEKIFIYFLGLGAPFEVFFENKNKFSNKSIIFCCNDALSIVFLFFKSIGIIKNKIIVNFQGLSERRLTHFKNSKINFCFVNYLLSHAEIILTLSNISKKIINYEYKIDKKKISRFDFGVDQKFWKYKKWNRKRKYILSVGNDSNRDFETLINAVGKDFKLIIVTKKKFFNCPKNIKILNDVSVIKLKKLYQNAKLTIIPSKKVISENAGMSCIMQSMACGTPVVTSDLITLKEKFKESVEILFYRAGSVNSLNRMISKNYNNNFLLEKISKNAFKKIKTKYNYLKLSNQLNKHILSLCK